MGKKKDEKRAGKAKASKKKKELKQKKSPKNPLKGMHCTGCKKKCPLKDPHCKKGRVQAEALLKQSQ